MDSHLKQPQRNDLLKEQRLLRGWSQAQAAEELSRLCEDKPRSRESSDINDKMIGRWERGEHLPNLYYQRKLSLLYGKSLQELGFVITREARDERAREPIPTSDRLPSRVSDPVQLTPHQAIDLFGELPHAPAEQQLGAWLALGAGDLATLFDEGWSLEEVLTSLRIVLQGVQAMPYISRRNFGRKFLELGTAAVIGHIPLPMGKQSTAEERVRLAEALSASLIAGWRLFHTAGNAQVLAVGQAQLFLVQQSHALLPSRIRSGFYTSAYNLIGKASHLQVSYQEALEAHVNAHVAAMSTGDPWDAAQSLICQADSYQALNQHAAAIEAIEEALCLIGNPSDERRVRSKAQLLAAWTESALALKDWRIAEEKLERAGDLLDCLSPNEQFDRASWYQLAGKYAFAVGDYRQAIDSLETALTEVSPTWLIRRELILLPLLAAYTWEGDREACVATAEQAFSVVKIVNASTVNDLYATSLHGLLEAFPQDRDMRKFVREKLASL